MRRQTCPVFGNAPEPPPNALHSRLRAVPAPRTLGRVQDVVQHYQRPREPRHGLHRAEADARGAAARVTCRARPRVAAGAEGTIDQLPALGPSGPESPEFGREPSMIVNMARIGVPVVHATQHFGNRRVDLRHLCNRSRDPLAILRHNRIRKFLAQFGRQLC